MKAKLISLLLAIAIALLLGPIAWNYVAPSFGLPQLTVWQFFVAGVACRCMLGLGSKK